MLAAPERASAKKPMKPTVKPKKRKKPVSDSGSGSDGEFVPSGDGASDEDAEDAEGSAAEDASSTEEEEAPGTSGGAKPRKRATSKPQPAVAKRSRGGGGGSSSGSGGGSSSLLFSPMAAAADGGAELTVDAAWYGDASEVWGEAGEFVTDLAAALISGSELRLNPHGAAGWHGARLQLQAWPRLRP